MEPAIEIAMTHRRSRISVLIGLGLAALGYLAAARAQTPEPPAGVEPLAVDLFTSKNFYLDRARWTDPRYTRCNTPRQLTDMWTQGRVGEWGDCSVDTAAADIVSPYDYTSAAEHYAALLAQARAEGGPTQHTRTTLPQWDGWYRRTSAATQWTYGRTLQAATMISLLTPEYQARMTQMNYHEAVNNSPQWNASFCYPEGLMRWWSEFAIRDIEVMTTPTQVQFLSGVADNFIRKVLIGEQHVQQVPQWYGETVGFWDSDTLVAWTSNVQAWTLSHSMFEFSGNLEIIEVIRPSADGQGLVVEATFYDPEAFVRPLHIVTPWARQNSADPRDERYTYVECQTQSQILNGPDGRPTQLIFIDEGYIDFFGRPWAQNWEQHFEQDMERPE
jgi:hypothetical protein